MAMTEKKPLRPPFALFLFVAAFSANACFAQSYPSKPIRIVTSAPGGAGDIIARLIGQSISGPLGQPIIVDNRAAGVIQAEIVSRAPADGYTLFVQSNILWLLPFMRNDLPYQFVRDFSPITLTNTQPNVLV